MIKVNGSPRVILKMVTMMLKMDVSGKLKEIFNHMKNFRERRWLYVVPLLPRLWRKKGGSDIIFSIPVVL